MVCNSLQLIIFLQHDLNNFLAVAEELCVKGLTGEDQKGAKPPASAKSSPPVSGSSGIKRGPGRPPGPTSKRPKLGETRTSGVKGNRSLKFRLVRPDIVKCSLKKLELIFLIFSVNVNKLVDSK